MELDHSALFLPSKKEAPGSELAPAPLSPAKKLSWNQRRSARATARKLYLSNDLPAFLALAQAIPDIYQARFHSADDHNSLPLLQRCAADSRADWIRAVWADGARPADEQRAKLMNVAGEHGDAQTIEALLDVDPTLLFLTVRSDHDRYDALKTCVLAQNRVALRALLPAVIAEATRDGGSLARAARDSWLTAHNIATQFALRQSSAATMGMLDEFALHPQLDPASLEARSAAIAQTAKDIDDMPAFAKILLAKIEGLQTHIQKQDQTIMALGDEMRTLLGVRGSGPLITPVIERERPIATAPLGALGLLSQRFRKPAATPAATQPNPKTPR